MRRRREWNKRTFPFALVHFSPEPSQLFATSTGMSHGPWRCSMSARVRLARSRAAVVSRSRSATCFGEFRIVVTPASRSAGEGVANTSHHSSVNVCDQRPPRGGSREILALE